MWTWYGNKDQVIWLWIALCRRTRQVVAWCRGDQGQEWAQWLWNTVVVEHSGCGTQWLWNTVVVEHSGCGTQWLWNTVVVEHSGCGTQWLWNTVVVEHSGCGTQWLWNTVVVEHSGCGTQWLWNTVVVEHSGCGTQWLWNTVVVEHKSGPVYAFTPMRGPHIRAPFLQSSCTRKRRKARPTLSNASTALCARG